ncbi:MAG: hypothetical protein ACTSU5_10485 [Promethearchaeota archaeon]
MSSRLLGVAWDDLGQLEAGGELGTASIELVTTIAGLCVVLVILYLKRKYQKLTRSGFAAFIAGFSLYTLHLLFDLLDTLVTKKVGGVVTAAYTAFDTLDAVFSFVGLFVIGLGFLQSARYGAKVWDEEPGAKGGTKETGQKEPEGGVPA